MKNPAPSRPRQRRLAQAPSVPPVPVPDSAPASVPRPVRDVHGVDMRTQAGPAGPRYSPPFPVDPKLPNFWLIGDLDGAQRQRRATG